MKRAKLISIPTTLKSKAQARFLFAHISKGRRLKRLRDIVRKADWENLPEDLHNEQ